MILKKLAKVTALGLAALLSLSACGSNNSKPQESGQTEQKPEEKKQVGVADNLVIENEGTPVEDATLKVALISNSPFTGLFNIAYAITATDMRVIEHASVVSFNVDEQFKIGKGGAAEVDFKPEERKINVKIHKDYTWNDGTPVTSKDYLQYYKIVAHKDYTGSRFDSDMRNVEGIEAYHKGETEEISGFKEISDKEFEVTFVKFIPGILWGSGIPTEAVPAHIYGNIPVSEQEAHDATRKNPLSAGPYVMKDIVPGQQVVLEANPHYYKGAPKVKNVIFKIVPSAQVVAALESGEYDLTINLDRELYPKLKDLKNLKLIVRDEMGFNYLGFKLGKWDNEKKEVVTDPNAKMADVKLRQAMAYAVDNDKIGEKVFHGMTRNATQMVIPPFKDFYNKDLEGYVYNEEKSKQLLDEAGFKDVNGDGIREDKNGQPLVIKFAAMSGAASQEPLTQYYIQQWKNVGLNVELTTGRLIEFNSFYEKVQGDDPEVDVFLAGFGTGNNPNPSQYFARTAAFNFSRFSSPELDAILGKIDSKEAIDDTFRANAYKEYTKYIFDNAPLVPVFYRKQIIAVNNRVKKYDGNHTTNFRLSDIELTAKEPIK